MAAPDLTPASMPNSFVNTSGPSITNFAPAIITMSITAKLLPYSEPFMPHITAMYILKRITTIIRIMFESSIFWIAFLALPEPLRSVAMIKGVMSCANIISNSVVAIFIPLKIRQIATASISTKVDQKSI